MVDADADRLAGDDRLIPRPSSVRAQTEKDAVDAGGVRQLPGSGHQLRVSNRLLCVRGAAQEAAQKDSGPDPVVQFFHTSGFYFAERSSSHVRYRRSVESPA